MPSAIASLMESPPDLPPDSYVSRIQQGDVAAFDAVFRQYYPRLFAFARSYGRLAEDMAEDIICDVFGWVWRHREDWRPSTSIEAYLYGAVRNKIQNLTRDIRRDLQRRSRYALWEESPGTGERGQPADIAVERHEVRELVQRYVNELPENHRLIVLLRWEKQWSWQEIAEATGISSSAAQMQHLRALKTLRERLPKYFTK